MRRATTTVHLSTSIAALAALTLGCGKPPPAPAAPPPAPASIAPPPAPPAGPPIETEDHLVRVPRPSGNGWECAAERVAQPDQGVTVSFVQCRLETPAGKFSLMAKDYQVPPRAVMTAEELSTVEYPKHYRKRFDDVRYTRSGPIDHRGYPAYEVEIDMSRHGGPVTRVIERVLVVGTHTMNLSATGPAGMFPALAADVRRWFDGADFGMLRGDPLRQASL
ncbi:MAG: hypothetical protein QM820_34730 [Minicystis sp.]